MFWGKKKNVDNSMRLYKFNFSVGYFYVSGLSPKRSS